MTAPTSTQTHYSQIIGLERVSSGSQNLINPSTGETFATVAVGTPEDVARAVEVAKEAQKAWGALSPGERGAALLKFADALEARVEHLARLESVNAGKPIKLALHSDIPLPLTTSATSPASPAGWRGPGRAAMWAATPV